MLQDKDRVSELFSSFDMQGPSAMDEHDHKEVPVSAESQKKLSAALLNVRQDRGTAMEV